MFLKRAMKRYGGPESIVTDRLPSYRAAMGVVGVSDRQEYGRRLNNRAENSHQPFRRREGEMSKFLDIETLQKSSSRLIPGHGRICAMRSSAVTIPETRTDHPAAFRPLAVQVLHVLKR